MQYHMQQQKPSAPASGPLPAQISPSPSCWNLMMWAGPLWCLYAPAERAASHRLDIALQRPQALHSVATVFLSEEDLPSNLRAGIVDHMVGVHQSVRQFSTKFEQQLRRHNYVTVSKASAQLGAGDWRSIPFFAAPQAQGCRLGSTSTREGPACAINSNTAHACALHLAHLQAEALPPRLLPHHHCSPRTTWTTSRPTGGCCSPSAAATRR